MKRPNPDWVTQKQVIEGLQILADRGLTFDVVAVFPNHLKHVPTLAEKVPNLKMVIDHLAKPPLGDDDRAVWRAQLAAAAESPNVYAKVSGLNTVTPDFENWTYEDIKPLVDYALEQFGADRLMFGSDWPVAVLAGDYAKVWDETNKCLADLSGGRARRDPRRDGQCLLPAESIVRLRLQLLARASAALRWIRKPLPPSPSSKWRPPPMWAG